MSDIMQERDLLFAVKIIEEFNTGVAGPIGIGLPLFVKLKQQVLEQRFNQSLHQFRFGTFERAIALAGVPHGRTD
jgi:hypothetical protein